FLSRLKSTQAGREQVDFAEALSEVLNRLQRAEKQAQARNWKRNFLLIAATLALVVGGAQFLRSRRAEPHRTAVLAPAAPPPLAVWFFLTPGLHRGTEELRRLQIPSAIALVRLQLTLPPGPTGPTYQAKLLTADGREVWSQSGLAGGVGFVEVEVP